MTTSQFRLLATLSIFEGEMTAGDMLRYLDCQTLTQEDQRAAKHDLATLIGAGLIGMKLDQSDRHATRLWLTERGTAVVDVAATIKVDQMIQDWQSTVPSYAAP